MLDRGVENAQHTNPAGSGRSDWIGFVTASAASAQAYPSRPIRIIVPFLAGGTVDIVARQIGQQLSPCLGNRWSSTIGRAAAPPSP